MTDWSVMDRETHGDLCARICEVHGKPLTELTAIPSKRAERAARRDALREQSRAEAEQGDRRLVAYLNDIDTVRRIHVQHGHASPRRLAQAIHQGSIIIPEVERCLTGPAGRRPPPLQHLVDALSRYQCPTCAKVTFRASPRNARKVGKDIRPFDVVHMDTIPLFHKEATDTKPLDPFLPDDPGGHLLLAVDEATRYTLTAFCENKTAPVVAAAFLELDNAIRHLMSTAREYNRVFADAMGYTRERIDDESRSIIRHVHSDNGTEFLYGIHPPGGPEGYGWGGREDRPHVERVDGGLAAPRATTSDPLRQYENGLAERRHQILKAKAKTLMDDAGFGWKAYGHAYRYAATMENLVTTTVPVANSTRTRRAVPFAEVLGFPYDTGKRPVAPFGAIAFQREPRHRKRQFGTSRDIGIYLGPFRYPSRKVHVATVSTDGYSVYAAWSPETHVLTQDFLTRSAQQRADFLRDQLGDPVPIPPFLHELEDTSPPHGTEQGAGGALAREPALQASSGSEDDEIDDDEPNEAVSRLRSIVEQRPRPRVIMTRSKQAAADAADAATNAATAATSPASLTDSPAEASQQPVGPATDDDVSPITAMIARVNEGTAAHLFPLISRDFSPRRAFAIRPSTDGTQRRTIEQCSPEEINAARVEEYRNLVDNGVFVPARLPRSARGLSPPLLDTKEVLKVRNDQSVKCRLTARGFMQRGNIDFFETYSPVATPATIRIVASIAASFGAKLKTADCASAYLQADCKDEIYVALPKDLVIEGLDLGDADCFQLAKSLYGLRQSGRAWFDLLRQSLLDCGMSQAPEDPTLFYKTDDAGRLVTVLCTVVDDLLGASTDEAWSNLMDDLQARGIKLDHQSVGDATEFNGCRITRTGKHVYAFDQEAFIDEMARTYTEAHGGGWRPKKDLLTPLGPTHDRALMKVLADEDKGPRELEADRVLETDPAARRKFNLQYANLLGSLLWLAVSTRPDLSFAASAAGQVASHPMSRHMKVLEHVLAYAIQTKKKGLVFDHTAHAGRFDLAAFSDADFATDELTRKSRSGVWIGVNGAPVLWFSKKQKMISDSTTAAETIAAHAALRQIRAIAGNLNKMGLHQKFTPLFVDNTVTLLRIANDKKTDVGGAKHLSVLTKSLQEAATPSDFFSDIWPTYVSTDENVADIFTKGYLSGRDVPERWQLLEARTRGASDDPHWVEKLLRARRPLPGNKHRLTEAIELKQPMTSLKEYLRLSGRGAVHENHFSNNPRQAGGAVANIARAPTQPRPDDANSTRRERKPRHFKALEVFCGPNKSMERALRELAAAPEMAGLMTISVDTLDIDGSCAPSIWADVRKFTPEWRFAPGELDFVWLSIPCPEYSVAKTTSPRDLDNADAISKAAIALLLTLRPKAFAIENPRGLFRSRDFVRPLLKFLKPTSYCCWRQPNGDAFAYRKPTDIFTNINCHLPHCNLVPCEYKARHGRHAETAQRGPSSGGAPGNALEDLHRVPLGLIQKLFVSAFFPELLAVEPYLPGDVPARETRALLKLIPRSIRPKSTSIRRCAEKSGDFECSTENLVGRRGFPQPGRKLTRGFSASERGAF